MEESSVPKTGEIMKKSELIAFGLTEWDVRSLCKKNRIERVRNGYYRLHSGGEPEAEQLISMMLKRAVVCMESALFYYDYADFTPHGWTVAVPRSYSRKIKEIQSSIPVKAYYVQDEFLDLGKTTGSFNGITLPVYDRERTICDCFKYRTKIDEDIFNIAMKSYISDPRKNMDRLAEYARKMKLYDKVMSLLGIWL